MLSLLVSRIEFDSSNSSLWIDIYPAGIKSFATSLEDCTAISIRPLSAKRRSVPKHVSLVRLRWLKWTRK